VHFHVGTVAAAYLGEATGLAARPAVAQLTEDNHDRYHSRPRQSTDRNGPLSPTRTRCAFDRTQRQFRQWFRSYRRRECGERYKRSVGHRRAGRRRPCLGHAGGRRYRLRSRRRRVRSGSRWGARSSRGSAVRHYRRRDFVRTRDRLTKNSGDTVAWHDT
jgi:hypothetical protein